MEVDIMWSGYYYLLESVFGGVWMWILCGYYYLLECFWGSLDVWMWISPNEKRETPPVPCCSPWDMSATRMVYIFHFHRLHHHKSSLYLPGTSIVTHHQCNYHTQILKIAILFRSKLGSQAQKWISVSLWWFFCRPAAAVHIAHLNRYTQNFSGIPQKLTWCHQFGLKKAVLGAFLDKIHFPGQTVDFRL